MTKKQVIKNTVGVLALVAGSAVLGLLGGAQLTSDLQPGAEAWQEIITITALLLGGVGLGALLGLRQGVKMELATIRQQLHVVTNHKAAVALHGAVYSAENDLDTEKYSQSAYRK